MGKRYENILGTVGNTPVVRLEKLSPQGVNVFVKIESFNPMGSVKDRLALGVIEDAERRGVLKPGQTIVEATSGNTGIGLAMVCAQKGYPLVITMAENFSVERRKMMRFLGAQVVLTPASQKGSGMVAKAEELARAHGWWQPRQFENPANAETHARTTAVEILEDFADVSLDYFVTGFGTGGTLNGIARVLKEKSPHTRIIVTEPDNAQMLGSGIAQHHRPDGSTGESHPNFRPHLMQGWSPDFIPKLAEEALARKTIDGFVPVSGVRSLECAKDLARREGIFVGISAGATLAGALEVAARAPEGTNILCILPDTGERYLSTPLFDDVAVEMTDEEVAISKSTAGYRFDVPAAPAPAPSPSPAAPAPEVALDEAAVREVEALLADPENPIVMFSLEWCEFCWSVRKMLAKYEIPYRSVDLDSVAYKENDRGGKIRQVLKKKTGWQTIPLIFVGGELVGGCTDVFDQCKEGHLAQRLEDLKVPFNPGVRVDPYSFLPGWLHPR